MKNHCRCRGMEWRAYALLHVEVQKKTNDANGSKHTISQNEPILLLFSCVPYKSRSFRFASRMIHGTAQLTDKTNNINLFKFMANHKSLEIFSILCSFFIETEWLESALHLLHSHTHTKKGTHEKWRLKCTNRTICSWESVSSIVSLDFLGYSDETVRRFLYRPFRTATFRIDLQPIALAFCFILYLCVCLSVGPNPQLVRRTNEPLYFIRFEYNLVSFLLLQHLH